MFKRKSEMKSSAFLYNFDRPKTTFAIKGAYFIGFLNDANDYIDLLFFFPICSFQFYTAFCHTHNRGEKKQFSMKVKLLAVVRRSLYKMLLITIPFNIVQRTNIRKL